MDTIRKSLDGINIANAGKKRDEALALLKKWFPEMERFASKLKQYNKTMKDLKTENAQLTAQTNAAKKEKWNSNMEFVMLQSELQKYKRFYEKLPLEVREQLNLDSPHQRDR